jgi:hypothetical protein
MGAISVISVTKHFLVLKPNGADDYSPFMLRNETRDTMWVAFTNFRLEGKFYNFPPHETVVRLWPGEQSLHFVAARQYTDPLQRRCGMTREDREYVGTFVVEQFSGEPGSDPRDRRTSMPDRVVDVEVDMLLPRTSPRHQAISWNIDTTVNHAKDGFFFCEV